MSIKNLTSASSEWVNVYTLTGIAANTAVNIQNHRGKPLRITTTDTTTAPTGDAVGSFLLQYSEDADIDGAAAVWVRANGGVQGCVQEVTA